MVKSRSKTEDLRGSIDALAETQSSYLKRRLKFFRSTPLTEERSHTHEDHQKPLSRQVGKFATTSLLDSQKEGTPQCIIPSMSLQNRVQLTEVHIQDKSCGNWKI